MRVRPWLTSTHLVAVHLVAVLEGEGLAHGDGDGVAHDGDGEGVSDHAGEERCVRNQWGGQPEGWRIRRRGRVHFYGDSLWHCFHVAVAVAALLTRLQSPTGSFTSVSTQYLDKDVFCSEMLMIVTILCSQLVASSILVASS